VTEVNTWVCLRVYCTPRRKEVVEKNHVGRHVEGALPFRFRSNGNIKKKNIKTYNVKGR
jgi:hypothetical protein